MFAPLITQEIRWFLPGEIPAEVQMWFDRLGEKVIQPPRTDIYLAGLDASVGVKLREGRLEIKHRMEDLGLQTFSSGITGQAANWIKWGFEIRPEDWPGTESTHWIPIRKERQMQFFTYTDRAEIVHSAPGVLPLQGGGVELSVVSAGSAENWWTVAIEMGSQAGEQGKIVAAMARLIFDDTAFSCFGGENSYSYPYWLANIPT